MFLDSGLHVLLHGGLEINVVKTVALCSLAHPCSDDILGGDTVAAFLSVSAQLVVVCRPNSHVNVEKFTQLVIVTVCFNREVVQHLCLLGSELRDHGFFYLFDLQSLRWGTPYLVLANVIAERLHDEPPEKLVLLRLSEVA